MRVTFATKVTSSEALHTDAQTLRVTHKLQRKQLDEATTTKITALQQKEKKESAALTTALTAKLDAEITMIREIS